MGVHPATVGSPGCIRERRLGSRAVASGLARPTPHVQSGRPSHKGDRRWKIAESLDALRPTNREYRALAELLADYRNRASNGQPAAGTDGVSLAERIKQIELNMERWRWLPREQTARHIVVNIPAFRLDVWERDAVALSMRVVVGKDNKTPTPIFIDTLTHGSSSPVPVRAGDNRHGRDPAVGPGQEALFLQRTTGWKVLDEQGQVVDPGLDSFPLPRRLTGYVSAPGRGNALGLV